MTNPLAAFSAAIIAGAWLGTIIPFYMFAGIMLILVIAASYKLVRFGAKTKSAAFLVLLSIVLAVTAGLARAQYVRRSNYRHIAPFVHQTVKVTGEVRDIRFMNNRTVIQLYAHTLEYGAVEYTLRTKINLTAYGGVFDAEMNDIIQAEGKIELYEPLSYRGDISKRSQNASEGVYAAMQSSLPDVKITGRNNRKIDLLRWGNAAREHIIKTTDKYLSGEEGALTKGLLIGDKQGFDIELYEAFRKSGMLHIVAVSGLHTGIFILFLSFGTGGFLTSRKWRSFVLLAGVFAYTVVIGAQPSILRASLMAAYGILAENFKLRKDSLAALLVSTSVLVLINPFLVHNVGFQLSFTATLGIILLQDRLCAYKIANAGTAAFLFTAPLLAYYFNSVTFASLITNILVSPLIIMSMLLGYIMCIVPPLGVVLSPVIFCMTHVMIMTAKYFASVKYLTVSVATPSLLLMACFGAALYLIYRLAAGGRGKRVAVLAATVLLAFNVFSALTGADDAEICFAETQSGDCVYIRTPDGYNVLVDCGSGTDTYNFLKSKNVQRIDAVILTNLKDEDTDGVFYLAYNIPISEIYMPSEVDAIETAAEKNKITVKYFFEGDSISAYGVRFDVVALDNFASTKSDASAVMKMTCLDTKVLFMGDFRQEKELKMLRSGSNVKCDIIRLASHGDVRSNGEELINAAGAGYAVANAGYNSGDRLDVETDFNLARAGTSVLKTYESGTISFAVSKDGIKKVKTTRIPIEEDL